MPLYFAYGSNMDLGQMAGRCPASRPIGVARLPRHRLVIMREGYASVARDPRRTVWGVIWQLAFADISALDRYEGVSGGLYTKTLQPVLTGEGARRALIYVGRDRGPGLPRPGYMDGVIAAAKAAGLPDAYLHEIGAFVARTSARPSATSSGLGGSRVQVMPIHVTPTRATPFDPDPRLAAKPWSWTP